jgi:hypothetical protein
MKETKAEIKNELTTAIREVTKENIMEAKVKIHNEITTAKT